MDKLVSGSPMNRKSGGLVSRMIIRLLLALIFAVASYVGIDYALSKYDGYCVKSVCINHTPQPP